MVNWWGGFSLIPTLRNIALFICTSQSYFTFDPYQAFFYIRYTQFLWYKLWKREIYWIAYPFYKKPSYSVIITMQDWLQVKLGFASIIYDVESVEIVRCELAISNSYNTLIMGRIRFFFVVKDYVYIQYNGIIS